MTTLPSSIELSDIQREILDLIIADQTGVNEPVEPERVVLLWRDGLSISGTARKLSIKENEVIILRHRWLEATPRIAAAERKFQRTFRELVSLIFQVPNDECIPKTVPAQAPGGN